MQMATERLGIGGLLLAGLLSGCGGGGGGGSSSDGSTPDISGVISLESRTRVDLDTADDIRVGESVTNDSRSAAQDLPGTTVTGGYLSASSGRYNTGTQDVFEYFEDRTDIYAVRLAPGDRIALQVFESPDAYFSFGTLPPQPVLKLVSSDGSLEEALDVGQSNTVPESFPEGGYFLEVSTSGGAPFRYVLTLADEGAASVMNTRYVEPDFLLGEAIVTFKPSLMPQTGSEAVARAMSANQAHSLGGGSWRVRQNSGAPVSAFSAQSSKQSRENTVTWIRELRESPDVAVAEPNYLYHAQQIQTNNDPLYSRQWNHPLINLPLAWQVAPEGGLDIGIAVMDTGLFTATPGTRDNWHPDIDSNVQILNATMDYVSAELDIDDRFGDPDGRDTNPADPGDGKSQSSNFHGTHVAGIAGSVDGNGEGGIGVAPNSNILPVRVLGKEGFGNSADLIAAVNWAAVRNEIDVINLSLGGLGPSQSLEDAIDRAYGAGKLVVAAAGNEGTDEATFPAAFANVVGVGAVGRSGERAPYSNVGPSVDLVAPGGNASSNDGLIISTWGTDDGGNFVPGYAGLQGTSMAAPHVAGVYALMKSVDADMTPDLFFQFLAGGQLTSPPPNRTEYGAGLIDALKAVDAALDGDTSTILAASPSSLQFNGVVNQQEFTFAKYPSNAGITITSVAALPSWLSIDLGEPPVSVNASEPVTVSVDTSGLDESESYRADIEISYTDDSGEPTVSPLTIPVTLQFGGSPEDLDAGRHYVLLVSTDDDRETIAQTVVNAAEGQYQFAFDEVAPGEYFLVAGTDMDNNGLICENGEACAEYPVNGLPEKIVIGGEPLSGVTLNTSFRRPTIAAMGMPRYGFEGYRLKTDSGDQDEPVRQVETDR